MLSTSYAQTNFIYREVRHLTQITAGFIPGGDVAGVTFLIGLKV